MEIMHSEERQNSATELSALYECWPGGPIVRNPSDCPERDTWRKFDVASIFAENYEEHSYGIVLYLA